MNWLAPLSVMLIALSGCSQSESVSESHLASDAPVAASSVVSTADIELGRKIYNFRCYYCHGYSGNARTLAATFVSPRPIDFTLTSPDALSRDRMITSVTHGRPGTAMMSFSDALKPNEIDAVVDFVRLEFMVNKAENTRYHIDANGWFNHERYRAAYPFALGELALDTPWEQLTPEQANGKRLFMTSCISCHDRGMVAAKENNVQWESYPLSYPRNNYAPGDATDTQKNPQIDTMASASPYLVHDRAPQLTDPSELEKQGETLFQSNCAFCHAADGTGKNWIGSFMQPHPRDLTSAPVMETMTKERLHTVIQNGLPGTSMPAWKSVLEESEIQAIIAYVHVAFHPLSSSTSSVKPR